MATIAEAMPHRDLPEWRSHTDSPACRSQAGFFVVLLRLVYGSHFSIISRGSVSSCGPYSFR